jgi:uncharacterized OB-fold protein
METMPDPKPLRTDAVLPVEGRVVLLGSRCRECGQVLFPRYATCLACDGASVEALEFAGTATLVSWTRVHMPTMRMQAPFDAGYVRLTEGPLIYAPVRAAPAAPFRVDLPMRVVPLMLGEGDDAVCGYQFAASSEGPHA